MAVNKPEKSDKAEGGMKRRPAGSGGIRRRK